MTSRPNPTRLFALVLGVAAVAALAGCGKTGELGQPAPLFGAQAKADYEAKQAADAAAKARDAAARRNQRGDSVFNPIDTPPTQAPYAPSLPGRTDPFGPAPHTPGAGSSTAPDR
jgi:hypothetical protein